MIIKPKYDTVCLLQKQKAVEAISETQTVMIRQGIWNSYEETETAHAIQAILRSGYGADVFVNSAGMFYVSIPCSSDMW